MRLKNVPFKKSLKDELRTAKKSKDFKDLKLKNPKDTSVNETKEIIMNLRRIWGDPTQNPKTESTKKSTSKK
tara:strand:+ start:652 stop:867 length:216 start_codon:yes stop_codon:yes gene_type:complete